MLLYLRSCLTYTFVSILFFQAIQNLCKEFSKRDQRIAFACMSERVRQSIEALVPDVVEVPLPVMASTPSMALLPTSQVNTVLQVSSSPSPHSNHSPAPLVTNHKGKWLGILIY